MRFPWMLVGLAALVSSTPLTTSHELLLPCLPCRTSNNQCGSLLSLKWSIVNGSLYANDDRVFPPSMSMLLRAPQRETRSKQLDHSEVELAYALEARPLSTEENGSPAGIVRVRVELLGPEGNPVSPNAALLDLLTNPDGSRHIARVRMEPTKSHSKFQSHKYRPWLMTFWKTLLGSLAKQSKDDYAASTSSVSEHDVNASPFHIHKTVDTSNETADSHPGFIASPYWSPTYASSSHRHATHDPSSTFMRLVRPVIVPALLGAVAGLIACMIGFVIGHLFMSVSSRLGFRTKKRQPQWSRLVSLETSSGDEKQELGPKVYLELV